MAHVHRTLGAFWHDMLHSVLHFEGKIWRTFPLLAWRPGELTRRYVIGERARFVSPMALFLFSAFLMFIVFTTLGGPFEIDSDSENRAQTAEEYRRDRAEALADIAKLQSQRRQEIAAGESTVGTDVELRVAQNALLLVDRLRRDELAREKAAVEREAQAPNGDPSVIASGTTPSGKRGKLTIGRTGVPAIDKALGKAEENPELLLYKLQNNAYKFSWLLIPLSVPLVWVLFLHRRRYRQFRAYDHTVFVTSSIAFMSLVLVALTFFRLVGISETLIGLAIVFVPPIHIYRQLKGAYDLSLGSAAWRTAAILLFAAMAMALFLGLLMLIGVVG